MNPSPHCRRRRRISRGGGPPQSNSHRFFRRRCMTIPTLRVLCSGPAQDGGGESGMEIVHASPQIASLRTVARGFDPEKKIEGTSDEVLCVDGRLGGKVCPSQATKMSERHYGAQGSESCWVAAVAGALKCTSSRQKVQTWKALSDETKAEAQLGRRNSHNGSSRSFGLGHRIDDEDVEECQGPLLENGVCTALLGEVATQFAKESSSRRSSAVKLGRMTARQKPDGGVRGVVAGDVFQRLVGRTLAEQFAEQSQAAFHPCKNRMCCTRCASAYQC